MRFSRNLWSVLLVAGTVAVGTLVLVLSRDDAETAFIKRLDYDPLGALTVIADESKAAKSSRSPSLDRQGVIMTAVDRAFGQDSKLTTKIIGEQMQGPTRTIAIVQLVRTQLAVGYVVRAMDTQLLISGDKTVSAGVNSAIQVASEVSRAEFPEALLWLAKLKTKEERLLAYDRLSQSFRNAYDDQRMHELFLANQRELEDWRRKDAIASIASIRHMKGDTAGLTALREFLPESEREWVDLGMLWADAMQPRDTLMARAAKLSRARGDAISVVIGAELKKDALAAAGYVMSLPDELFVDALYALGNAWRITDIAAYAAWVRSLPPEPRREQAIAAFVTINRGQTKPRSIAREIAELAANPVTRERLAESVR